MSFNLKREIDRATAAYLSTIGIAIPASILKPVSGLCAECGQDCEDWCEYNEAWLHDECAGKLNAGQAEDYRLDDPRRGQGGK